MVTEVETIRERISGSSLPDGNYEGFWSGYNVDVVINGRNIELAVNYGARGLLIPCIVKINNGSVTVTSK